MLIGAIADDLTGATDLALMLSKGGMRTVLTVGGTLPPPAADAVVMALKSRTIPADQAVGQSLRAAEALLSGGAQQLFFKYCSTFDSTPAGNIGPVASALRAFIEAPIAIACPAFPAAGRTVFRGHLFIGDALLSESPMRDHPLTPMHDSNLVRVLQAQTADRVGLIPYETVARGPAAVREALAAQAEGGVQLVIVDAIVDDDLRTIGEAVAGMRLVTGGSGIALGLPDALRAAGRLAPAAPVRMAPPKGRRVVLAGSCSTATRRQVRYASDAGMPSLQVDPQAVAEGRQRAEDIVKWIVSLPANTTSIVYSSVDPETVAATQQRLGLERSSSLVEEVLAGAAKGAHAHGFTQFVVAGGETSGAVAAALGVTALAIGPEIDPGVPWTTSIDLDPKVALAFKSGNFGADDLFVRAWSVLQ